MANSDIEISLKSNKKEVLSEFDRKKLLALAQIGLIVEGYAKQDCPVDTGRLRNSITYATAEKNGSYTYTDNNKNSFSDNAPKPDDKNYVNIGTNVIYAARQEFGDSFHHTSGKAHFLRDACQNHKDEIKKEAEKILKAK